MAADESCVFCRIVAGQLPAEFLHSDDTCFAIRDIAPAARVHLLVIPRGHVTHLDGIGEDGRRVVGHLASVATSVAVAEGIAESGYRLVINQRDDAGQEVDHLHLHVLGGEKLGGMVQCRH